MQAFLFPPTESTSTGAWSWKLVKNAREESQRILTRVRTRAARYLHKARHRAYKSGFDTGLKAASKELETIISCLTQSVAKQRQRAMDEILEVAPAMAKAIIKTELTTSPAAYRAWLTEAADYLTRDEAIALHHAPTNRENMEKVIAHSTLRIELVTDPHLTGTEVYLTTRATSSGNHRLGFGWQEALDLLSTREHK